MNQGVRVKIENHIWTHEAVLEVPDVDAAEVLANHIATAVERFADTKLHWEQVARLEEAVDLVLKGDDHTQVVRPDLSISLSIMVETNKEEPYKGDAMSKFYAGAHPDNDYWGHTKTLIKRLVNAGFAYPTGSRVYAPTAVTDTSDVDYVVDTRKLSADHVGFLLEGCGLWSHPVTEAETEIGEIIGAEYDGAEPVYIVDRVVSEEGCYLVPARPEPEPRFNLILPKPEDVDGWLYATKTLELVRDKGDSWLVRALQDKDSRVAMFRLLRFVKREQ